MDVKCPSCQQLLRVPDSAAGKVVSCPKCKTQLKLPAAVTTPKPSVAAASSKLPSSNRPSSQPPSSQPPSSKAPSSKAPRGTQKTPQRKPSSQTQGDLRQPVRNTNRSPAEKTPATSQQAAVVNDDPFADLSLPGGGPEDAQWDMPPAASGFKNSSSRSVGTSPTGKVKRVVQWLNQHRWITLILSLNMLCLIFCLSIHVNMIALAIGELIVGVIVIGLLQIPRYHVIGKLVSQFGMAAANLSGGMFLAILAGAGLKLARMSGKVGGMDLDMSQIPTLIGSLLGMFAVIAIAVYMWHQIGMMRLIGTAYVGQLALVTMLVLFGRISLQDELYPDRSSNGSRDPMMQSPYGPDGTASSAFEQREQMEAERRRRADEARRERMKSFAERSKAAQNNPGGIVVDITYNEDDEVKAAIEKVMERLAPSGHRAGWGNGKASLRIMSAKPWKEIVSALEQVGTVDSADEEKQEIKLSLQ